MAACCGTGVAAHGAPCLIHKHGDLLMVLRTLSPPCLPPLNHNLSPTPLGPPCRAGGRARGAAAPGSGGQCPCRGPAAAAGTAGLLTRATRVGPRAPSLPKSCSLTDRHVLAMRLVQHLPRCRYIASMAWRNESATSPLVALCLPRLAVGCAEQIQRAAAAIGCAGCVQQIQHGRRRLRGELARCSSVAGELPFSPVFNMSQGAQRLKQPANVAIQAHLLKGRSPAWGGQSLSLRLQNVAAGKCPPAWCPAHWLRSRTGVEHLRGHAHEMMAALPSAQTLLSASLPGQASLIATSLPSNAALLLQFRESRSACKMPAVVSPRLHSWAAQSPQTLAQWQCADATQPGSRAQLT